jgi:hypothetical protein
VSEPTGSSKDVQANQSVNAPRVETYKRLMESQERIAHALYRRGVSNEVVQNALDTADERLTDSERREDLYLSALAHYVDALGGRLEVRAIFDGEQVVLRGEPA